MQKTTRRKFFYALVAVFLVLGTGVVLYAEGWRIDFATLRPEKVGGIFVRAYPENASITLDGKPIQSELGLLSRGTLINGLLPHSYTLALATPGYDSWQETAAVAQSLVTEFKYAVLVPGKATTTATGTITAFALTATGPAIQTPTGVKVNDVSAGTGTIIEASSLSSAILLKRPSGVYVLYTTPSSTANLSNIFAADGVGAQNISALTVNPYNNPPQVAAANQSRLWVLDLATQKILFTGTASDGTVLIPNAIAFSPSLVAWAVNETATSSLDFYNFNTDTFTQSVSVFPGQTAKLSWLSGTTFAALQKDGALYRYDLDSQTFTKMADDVVDFTASDDGSMLAALEQHSLEIFSLGSTDYWRFNLPDGASIQKLIWYRDARHLFVVYPDHVSFLDLSDSALTNFTSVAQGTAPEYDPSTNSLYLLDLQRHLIQFTFPT
jgi:hypothetical protein